MSNPSLPLPPSYRAGTPDAAACSSRVAPHPARSRAPRLLAALLLAAAGAQAQGQARFDIQEYVVEGNSLLGDAAIEQAVMPHMGEQRSLDDVEAARQSLMQRYHEAGYLTVQVAIPEQQVDAGVVRLRVVEAPVQRLRVKGAEYHLPSRIAAAVDELAEGKVPNFPRMQQQLGELNRGGNLRVSPVLKAGAQPGTVEAQLDVEDQLPLHGSVELNNRQGLNTDPLRLSAALRYENLWQRGHSLGLNLQLTPQDPGQVRSAMLSYLWPTGAAGESMSLYVASSRSQLDVLYNLPGMGLVGNTDTAGLRYSLPMLATDALVQTLSLGLDYKHVHGRMRLDAAEMAQPSVHYTPLALSYRAMWLQQRPQPTVLDVGAVLGMRGLMGNRDPRFGAKDGREGISSNFMALRAGLQASQELGAWTLGLRSELQLASGPLLSNEQFAGGGAESVRGYREAERLGDQAWRLSLELATPTLQDVRGTWRLSGLAFADQAQLQLLHPAAGQASHRTLAGAGLGLRAWGPRGTGLQLDAARALRDGDVAGGGTARGDWRLHARLTLEY